MIELETNNKKLTLFLHKIAKKLYDAIKDDYTEDNDLSQIVDMVYIEENKEKIKELLSHKMNLILYICRNSSIIKKLSAQYNEYINSNHNNSNHNNSNHNDRHQNNTADFLYQHIQQQLIEIKELYHNILKSDDEYKEFINEDIFLYSGMTRTPNINDNKTVTTLFIPIDTTIRPIQDFIYSNDHYYFQFKTKLESNIIPILNICNYKLMELFGFYEIQEEEVFLIAIGNYTTQYLDKPKTYYNTVMNFELEEKPSAQDGLRETIFSVTNKILNDSYYNNSQILSVLFHYNYIRNDNYFQKIYIRVFNIKKQNEKIYNDFKKIFINLLSKTFEQYSTIVDEKSEILIKQLNELSIFMRAMRIVLYRLFNAEENNEYDIIKSKIIKLYEKTDYKNATFELIKDNIRVYHDYTPHLYKIDLTKPIQIQGGYRIKNNIKKTIKRKSKRKSRRKGRKGRNSRKTQNN
jgi:hypothetical protein